jgi:hypothetical protein
MRNLSGVVDPAGKILAGLLTPLKRFQEVIDQGETISAGSLTPLKFQIVITA